MFKTWVVPSTFYIVRQNTIFPRIIEVVLILLCHSLQDVSNLCAYHLRVWPRKSAICTQRNPTAGADSALTFVIGAFLQRSSV